MRVDRPASREAKNGRTQAYAAVTTTKEMQSPQGPNPSSINSQATGSIVRQSPAATDS